MVDLIAYRELEKEQERINHILGLIKQSGESALDVGARDGFISKKLTAFFSTVVALDLEKLDIEHEKVKCVQGDITHLQFPDNSFDLVFCAEVLEHIPTEKLEKACHELARVAKKELIVGVPYKQDIRVGQLTCQSCGHVNPPWGHVNTFDENKLQALFPSLSVKEISFVGKNHEVTNSLSALLMTWAGNPFGDYNQEEPCIFCNEKFSLPPKRNILQKILTKVAFLLVTIQKLFSKSHHNWIHMIFEK